MSLRLYDTATREVSEFVPLRPGHVGIYLCGATVQASPHIGHLRPVIAFDILRRWLERCGLEVTMIRNVTDIDDKILAKAAVAGVDWWAHAAAIEREFTAAYNAVGVLPPTYEPRATAHIPQMTELVEALLRRGHAYKTGGGNVWFDVPSWPHYGELTRQRLSDLAPEAHQLDSDPRADKRSPHDFALWKAAKPGEPATASWQTPWGAGRPGWHLECSAMAQRYLGDEFDIHGGGLDLRFPHHENEQAQSRAAGYGFAQRWLHSAWITQAGAKMSKSLGNGLLVSELLAQAPAPVIRYAIASVQYRSMLEWTKETLAEAQATWDRLAGFVERASARLGSDTPSLREVRSAPLPEAFVEAMDDDLNVPAALAVVHEYLRQGNSSLSAPVTGRSVAATRSALVSVRAMLDVLGLDPGDPHWRRSDDAAAHQTLHRLISAELDERAAARKAKDWATADAIRDRLAMAGVAIEDTPTGARWSLADD